MNIINYMNAKEKAVNAVNDIVLKSARIYDQDQKNGYSVKIIKLDKQIYQNQSELSKLMNNNIEVLNGLIEEKKYVRRREYDNLTHQKQMLAKIQAQSALKEDELIEKGQTFKLRRDIAKG